MNLNATRQGKITIVEVDGRLDAMGGPVFEQYCLKLIGAGDTRLLIDLAAVPYISSAGLRSLLVIAKAVKAGQGELAVCNPAAMVREIMEVACLDRIFALAGDREAALASFGGLA